MVDSGYGSKWCQLQRQRRRSYEVNVTLHNTWNTLPIRLEWRRLTERAGLLGCRLVTARQTTYGFVLEVKLELPSTADDVERSLRKLAVGLRAHRCVLGHMDRADLVELRVFKEAAPPPTAYPSDPRPVFIPAEPSCPVPLGTTDEGSVLTVPLFGHSLLIAGSPGAGKSNAIRCILASLGLSGRRNLALVGIDPKRVELSLWRPRFSALVEGNEAEPTISLLTWLVDEVQRRAAQMSKSGLVQLTPSSHQPAIVLVVDEWAELAADGTSKQRDEANRLLRRFISLGRATGCSAVLATQRPTSDNIDTSTRALLAYRLALRSDRYGSEATLGTGYSAAALIPVGTPGRGLLSDGGPPVAIRVFDMDPARVESERCSGLHMALPGIPAPVDSWFSQGSAFTASHQSCP